MIMSTPDSNKALDHPPELARNPVRQTSAPTSAIAAPDAPSATADLRGRRILVVDDNKDNRRLMELFLRDGGAQITFAENGQECLNLVETASAHHQPFDMILLDMHMPVMDGYSAARRLRDNGCRIPIVAVTASVLSDDREKCLLAGCDDYLPKPINSSSFHAIIRKNIAPADQTDPPSSPGSSSNFANDPSFAPILAAYLSRMPDVSEQLRAGIAAKDANRIRVIAHKIRGTAANYGFPRITELAGQCDEAVRSGTPWPEILTAAEALDQLVQATIARSASRR